jgi:hypothetical protein
MVLRYYSSQIDANPLCILSVLDASTSVVVGDKEGVIYERCFQPFLVLISSFGVRASTFWPPFKNKAKRGGEETE